MKYQTVFALAVSLSRLRRDACIPELDHEDFVERWLDGAEPSKVLSVVLEIVNNARQAGLLPEDRWVELVSHMRIHRSPLLASALALTYPPEDIQVLQYYSSLGCFSELKEVNLNEDHALDSEARTSKLREKISSVSKDCTRESFWKLTDPSPHQEGRVGKEEHVISSPHLQEGIGKEKFLEGASAEAQTQPAKISLSCSPSLYEKVIVPLLVADRQERQALWRDRVLGLRWGTLISDSREKHLSKREDFVAELSPPQHLRIIDCHQSLEKGVVVLIDRHHPGVAYTAISHTFGQDVYEAYDCGCATMYMGDRKARANPAEMPCPGHQGPDEDKQSRVMNDMLNMCRILVEKAGVRFAWHDGICIAQYDEEDLKDAITHMGWIYANAADTVVFLHYVGEPMAPIGTGYESIPLVSRWHTRAWTFQEAILSKHRRYCVRHSKHSLGSCSNWQDFEEKLALWYVPSQSTIEIVNEADFFHSLILLHTQLKELHEKEGTSDTLTGACRVDAWTGCLVSLLDLLESALFFNVTMAHALQGSSSRDSKHPGDHINSILALAGVKEFSVPKDERVEEWTLEFFKKMDKKGLEFAVFTTNVHAPPSLEEVSMHRLTWVPSLCGALYLPLPHVQDGGANFNTNQIEFEVLEESSHIKLTGPLVCVPVRFYWKKSESQSEESEAAAALSSVVRNPVMLHWNKKKQHKETVEAAESSWIAASVVEDISVLAELHSSEDDGLGVFLTKYKSPASRPCWMASELRRGGGVLGQVQIPAALPPHRADTIRDGKTLMEFSNLLQDNVGKVVRAVLYDDKSEDADVYVGDTVQTMHWCEAWAYCFLSRESPYPVWVEAMRKFFTRRTAVRDALTRCGKYNYSGLMFCLQEFFDFPTVHTFVPSQRCEMGTFRASLVLPAEVLSRDSTDFDMIGFQTLVINGDCVHSPVTKIGCLTGGRPLHELLVSKRINFRHLTELEIC